MTIFGREIAQRLQGVLDPYAAHRGAFRPSLSAHDGHGSFLLGLRDVVVTVEMRAAEGDEQVPGP